LPTVAEATAVLGMKEATVRAWMLKRNVTYVKLGRVVRIPAKGLELQIERATVPSR
jgi:excisionase family DNA binding protein